MPHLGSGCRPGSSSRALKHPTVDFTNQRPSSSPPHFPPFPKSTSDLIQLPAFPNHRRTTCGRAATAGSLGARPRAKMPFHARKRRLSTIFGNEPNAGSAPRGGIGQSPAQPPKVHTPCTGICNATHPGFASAAAIGGGPFLVMARPARGLDLGLGPHQAGPPLEGG
jgi:hypothetical protein